MLAGMKITSLSRSIPYWLLLVVSLVASFLGGWLVMDNTATMQRTLLDGSATNVEVYVGQAWITSGAAVLAAGIIGILLALGLAAAKALVSSAVEHAAEVDETPVSVEEAPALDEDSEQQETPQPQDSVEIEAADQNGSNGSTATATKISVK